MEWIETLQLKCIWRTFIHPSKVDSPYSPFNSPFFKVESPFSNGEWVSQNKIHPSKGVNAFTHEGDSPFKKGESLSKRVNHPSKGWIIEKGEMKKGEWRMNHPSKGLIKKGWIDKEWMEDESPLWRVNWKRWIGKGLWF